jgi:hypothetical protein
MYKHVISKDIKYIISGHNYATEYILPKAWGYNAMDSRHLLGIHKRFGKKRLKTYVTMSLFDYCFYYPRVKKIKVIRPLNYIPYNKSEAIEELKKELGWRYYGGKHHESRFTRFFQSYYLPARFGYDKRKAHLSSLIVSGQISRGEALGELKKELYPENELREDREFIVKKLGLTEKEFEDMLSAPKRTFKDYPSDYALFSFMNFTRDALIKIGIWR